jgi:hypothetical protein
MSGRKAYNHTIIEGFAPGLLEDTMSGPIFGRPYPDALLLVRRACHDGVQGCVQQAWGQTQSGRGKAPIRNIQRSDSSRRLELGGWLKHGERRGVNEPRAFGRTWSELKVWREGPIAGHPANDITVFIPAAGFPYITPWPWFW